MAHPAAADGVRGVRSAADSPLIPRGGVMMVRLTAERPGTNWPSTIELRLSDGRRLQGQVAWVFDVPAGIDRRWTDDPRGLAIRPVQASDDSTGLEPGDERGPYLLARMPANANGDIHLGAQQIQPAWRDVPALFPHDADETLPLAAAPDRPDPVSPFEYWRWVLLAQRLDMNPPEPFGGEVERLAAQHIAALWRIGLARLAAQSQRVTEQCLQMLTRTCIDRRQPFAAWQADPDESAALLRIMLDSSASDAAALAHAVAWLDRQPPLLLWPDAEGPTQVRLMAAAMRSEPVVAALTWRGSSQAPIAVQIQPGVLTQIRIDRAPAAEQTPGRTIGREVPGLATGGARDDRTEMLIVSAAGRDYEFAVGPRVAVARPPGLLFGQLAPPLTLAEVQTVRQRPAPAEYATLMQVRRMARRWEAYFECRRPGAPPEIDGQAVEASQLPVADAAADSMPQQIARMEDLRRIEAVTLLIGPEDDQGGPTTWLTVPERGWHQVVIGTPDSTLQIHKQSFTDRWTCRIVLPDSWLGEVENEPLLVACIRSYGDADCWETGPNACAPWRAAPARAAIDLSTWTDLPPGD